MTVLFSSAGRRVGLMRCFREALAETGLDGRIVAADAARHAPAAHLADAFHLIPRCTEAGFFEAMLDVCRRERVRVLVPTIDTELAFYAEHRDAFAAEGVHVAISGAETVEIAADKRRTNAWMREQGFPVVRQAALKQAFVEAQGWGYPLIVKPARGSASVGLRRVLGPAELLALNAQGQDLVVEEIARGVEHTVHVYVDALGRCLCAVPCRRLEVRSGEVSKGLTAKRPRLMELARTIAEALPGARGPLNIQIFEDEEGEQRVIEINARFGGGYPLAQAAGAPFARWIVEEAQGRTPEPAFDDWQDDLAMLRFDEAVYLPGAEIRGEDAAAEARQSCARQSL
ncbi:MAG: ATP-grasp domain-containing protein [Bryobacterales bacterium]|nr:ATP-grasp domain-containing protein [Bryobacterales bacterium]